MKHAGPQAIEALEPLLEKLRSILITVPGVVERKRGIFYRGATAFLHFHEDPAGMFADLRNGADFERYAVNTNAEIARLLHAVKVRTASPVAKRTAVRNPDAMSVKGRKRIRGSLDAPSR
jgi:hypothetical protein